MDNKKLKITVYAIAKNEEKFVDKWVKNMSEADKIVVLDTGSTDNTVQMLKDRGVYVEQKIIKPWRFDVARNESLKLIPQDTDVCVCTDLDEVFEAGWRKKIEQNWKENTKKLKYTYVWSILENGQDGVTFTYEKIHALNAFKWIYPVHEVLQSTITVKKDEIASCPNLILRHYPDKDKSRAQYSDLIKLALKEDPKSPRYTHYIAKEAYADKNYDLAIKFFKRHLKLKTSTWKEERCSSLKCIGDCYKRKNNFRLAKFYYEKAIKECITIRDPFLPLAELYYKKQDYLNCSFVLERMLKITTKKLDYMTNPKCWNEYPYDMLSFCYFKLNLIELAYYFQLKALEINPNVKRMQDNCKYYAEYLKKIK